MFLGVSSVFITMTTRCEKGSYSRWCEVGKISESEIFRINATHLVALQDDLDEEIISEVRKLLNSGTFYFSVCAGDKQPLDLTLCSQRRFEDSEPDNRFFW